MTVHQLIRDLEAKLLHTLTHFLHPFESRLMAKISDVANGVALVSENVTGLKTDLTTFLSSQGDNQAAFEAQLDPIASALTNLNTVVGELRTALAPPTA